VRAGSDVPPVPEQHGSQAAPQVVDVASFHAELGTEFEQPRFADPCRHGSEKMLDWWADVGEDHRRTVDADLDRGRRSPDERIPRVELELHPAIMTHAPALAGALSTATASRPT